MEESRLFLKNCNKIEIKSVKVEVFLAVCLQDTEGNVHS